MVSEVAKEIDAQIIGEGANVRFSRVSTDTRTIMQGDLFVALVGDNFNGHRFVKKAIDQGACCAVVSELNQELSHQAAPQLLVKDTLVALGRIGALRRRQFTGCVIALTGSSGKTTVKEMLASIMQEVGSTHATDKNFNNEIGVPMTLLDLTDAHDFAVVEMGASRAGDIRYLREIVRPDIVLVNNVMAAHIEGFGSIDGVATAKGEIYDQLPQHGKAILNKDEPYFEQWVERVGKRESISFSMSETNEADFYPSERATNKAGGITFQLNTPLGSIAVSLQVIGEHNINNALAAAAASYAAGATLENIKSGLEAFSAVKGRLFVLEGVGQSRLIDDTYNANPGSVRSAIDVIAPGGDDSVKKRILVLGDMGELGDRVVSLHEEVGEYAKAKRLDQLLSVGRYSSAASKAFGEGGQHFPDQAALIRFCESIADRDTVLLVKGSRSSHMEYVVNALAKSANDGQKINPEDDTGGNA